MGYPSVWIHARRGNGIRAWTTGGNGGYKNRDTSYLLSPCFDFSGLNTDPRISFALSVHTEARVDGAWLELSDNGGQTWRKIGSQNDGVNWYNDSKINTNFAFWTGTNRVNWEIAQNILTQAARKDRVRVRFAFTSDAKNEALFDGIAVDNLIVSEIPASDLAIDNIKRADDSDCGSALDSLSVRIFNLGSTAQNSFTVSYRLDNNVVVTDTVNNVSINPNQSVIYKFKAPVNTALPFGSHTFRAWVNQNNDNIRPNDTTRTTFFIAPPTGGNLAFNFDNALPPQYWIASRAKFEVGEHGNRPTNGYATANIFNDTIIVGRDSILTPNAQTFDLTTNKFGAVRATDSLSYAFRFVNANTPYAGYDLTNQDTFRVMASENCGRTWTMLDTISRSRHTPTDTFRSKKISLRQFEGKFIKIRFFVTSAINSSVGYFFDLDNVSFQSACPATFNAQATVRNVQGSSANGEITLANPTGGLAPYIYAWSNGATTQNLRNLTSGIYTVTITDGNSCRDIKAITVNQVTPTEELNSPIDKWLLAPNPTTDAATLTLELRKTTDVKVQIINLLGQVVSEERREKIKEAQFDIDLSHQPAGIYLIRILAENKVKTIRIAKQ
ncbi:MAG: T9SS type A sorting domain-containing protein [Saprospiraceae bacterium]|nr:T9SS type A sorting domain-containing protein [Saprospiraceae bacterium]